jgi:hypothetical protein
MGITLISFAWMVAGAAIQQTAFAVPATMPSTDQPPLTVSQMLDASIASVQLPDNYAYHVDAMMYSTGSTPPLKEKRTVDFSNAPGRYDCTISIEDEVDGKSMPPHGYREIWNAQSAFLRSQIMPHGRPGLVEVVDGVRRYPSSGAFDDTLDGMMFKDEKTAMLLLREAGTATLFGREPVDSHDCWIISGKTPFGLITVWLDPQENYHPRKIAEQKWTKDFIAPEITVGRDSFGSPKPGESITEIDYTVDHIAVHHYGPYIVGASGVFSQAMHFENGTTDSYDQPMTRTDFRINPDFAAEHTFQMDGIPDGTHVDHMLPTQPNHEVKYSSQEYIWKNGELMPDETAGMN